MCGEGDGDTFFGGRQPAVEGAAAVEEGEDAGAGGGGEGRCWGRLASRPLLSIVVFEGDWAGEVHKLEI